MKKKYVILCMIVCLIGVLPVSASGLGDIRLNARFLTDRMAFELSLNQSQYDDLFEINFDFLNSVDPYLTGMARSEAAALTAYYRFLDERNDDLRWILSEMAYARFLALEHFFRPVYAVNNVCYLRVYKVYPDHAHFYFGRPVHYYSYCGGHSRRHCGGASYYHRFYGKKYHHVVYHGNFRCRPEFRRHDFVVPGPSHRPVSPARPSHPGVRPSRPSGVPSYPAAQPPRPAVRPSRPETRPSHPGIRPSRPETRPSKPARPEVRPSHPEFRPSSPVLRPSRPETRPSRPAVRPSRPETRPSRPAVRPSRPEARPSRPGNSSSRRSSDKGKREGVSSARIVDRSVRPL